MATFGGSVYARRAMALKDISSSKQYLLSGWFTFDNGEGGTLLVGGSGATEYFKLSLSTSTGFLSFVAKNSSAAAKWSITSDTAYDDGSMHHFAISVDHASAARSQIYIDAAAATVTTNTALADDTIAFASADEWVVGADLAGATPLTGQLFDLVFWPGLSIDLSDTDPDPNIQLLVADDADRLATSPSSLKPVGYGSEGRDLGAPASILFSSGFQKNVGVGGEFVLTGSLGEDVLTASEPSGYRFFPRWRTPGERWFPSEQSAVPYPKSRMIVEQREGLYSYGKRIGIDEIDSQTRRERPGLSFSDIVLGKEEEDLDNQPR